MADKSKARTLSNFWSGCLLALSVLAGLSSLYFACLGKDIAALIAAILSVVWTVLAAGLLAFRSSARWMRAQLHGRVVDRAIDYLVKELEAERVPDTKDLPSKAELVDRLHGMALKALDEPNRRP